jgi:hypothetical protein
LEVGFGLETLEAMQEDVSTGHDVYFFLYYGLICYVRLFCCLIGMFSNMLAKIFKSNDTIVKDIRNKDEQLYILNI